MTSSVLVADDHPALVAAVASYLEVHDFAVVGPARDGERACELAAEHTPELALVDWRMPLRAGATLVRELLAASPETRVVVYTADGDQQLAREAFEGGSVRRRVPRPLPPHFGKD